MKKPDKPKQFHEFIRDYSAGDLSKELTTMMSELVTKLKSEAMAQGGDMIVKGEIALKLKFSADCTAGGRDIAIEMSYEAAKKEPKPARSRELFFAGKGGALVHEPPRQSIMEFDDPNTNKDLS